MKREDFADRLRQSAERIGGPAELSRRAGIPRATLSSYLGGASEPTVSRLVALANAAGVSIEWLATGQHGSTSERLELPRSASQWSEEEEPPAWVVIPRLPPAVASEQTEPEGSATERVSLAFRTAYLLRRGLQPAALRLVQAEGDSMEPLIRAGDTLLIDTSKHTLEDDAIYCVDVGERLCVKRLQSDLRGGIHVISDNACYRNEYFPAEDRQLLNIVGRAVCIGRDY